MGRLSSRLISAHESSVQSSLGSDIFKQAADRINMLENEKKLLLEKLAWITKENRELRNKLYCK